MITPLNQLPVIVDAPGTYLTRDGRTANVQSVGDNGDGTTTRYVVKGYLDRKTPGARKKADWTIWHVSGRRYGFKEVSSDILSKVTIDT